MPCLQFHAPPYANLINQAFTEMGVAFAVNSKRTMGAYRAQAFGTPR